jgi:hypothetical protein
MSAFIVASLSLAVAFKILFWLDDKMEDKHGEDIMGK